MSMVRIELTDIDLKRLIVAHISELIGFTVAPEAINIEVKSKQNYKSEWETAQFRAVFHQDVQLIRD